MAQRSKKTQRAQYENLINFLENNPVLVTGKTRSSDPNKISNLWQAFANAENARGNGPPKTADQWKKIFNDWKVNTKKKSKEIQVELNRTGGGVAVKKELTDLEERLLQLISSIHLGDPAIPDQLGGSTSQGVEVIDVPFEEENQYLTNEEEIIIEMEPPLEPALLDNTQDLQHMEQWQAVKETPTKREIKGNLVNTGTGGRKTTSILQAACSTFADSQQAVLEAEKVKADALNLLSSSIAGFTRAYREVEQQKADTERAKVRLAYFNSTGSYAGFDDYIKELERK